MMSLAVFLHRLDPFALRLWDDVGIRWYGLSYLAGFILAWLILRRLARSGRFPLSVSAAGDMVVSLAVGIVLGGRLGYVLLYDPALLWLVEPSFPFWGPLMIHRGGMASHGGMLGAILAAWLFARRHRSSWAHILDLAAFVTPPGLFFGRIANFINGELYGRPVSPDSPAMRWAVQFPQEMWDWSALQWQEFSSRVGMDVSAIPIPRLIELIRRGDPLFVAAAQTMLTPRHPSQLYEAILEGLILMLILILVWARPRKPLVVGGWFCLAYALLRIAGEFFRMPDAHIAHLEFAHWHITRGQLLSLGLLAAGLVILLVAPRRKVPPVGGLFSQKLPSS